MSRQIARRQRRLGSCGRMPASMAVHDRRTFLAALAGALAAPPRVGAQPATRPPRLGLLSNGTADSPNLQAFRKGLRDLGWIEGSNIAIEYRVTGGKADRLPQLAAELADLKVDVIAAGPTPAAIAAKKATGTIPIVMLGASAPIELGLVASHARPGGNVTG